MLEQVLAYLNNWFLVTDGVHDGTYTVEGGGIVLPFLADGQYFRIIGSVFNDGLHQYPANDLTPETFSGAVWALAIPKGIETLAERITEWAAKYGDTAQSPYTNESFGGYSYTKSTSGGTDKTTTWQGVFSQELAQYRKPRELGVVQPTRPYTPETQLYNPYPWR
jgi:hypothetical protein